LRNNSQSAEITSQRDSVQRQDYADGRDSRRKYFFARKRPSIAANVSFPTQVTQIFAGVRVAVFSSEVI